MKFDITQTPRRASRYYQGYDRGKGNQTKSVITTENLPVAPLEKRPRKRGVHWLLPVGVGMLVMLSLYVVFVQVVVPKYVAVLDRWNYGEARVSHVHTSVYPGKVSDIYALSTQNVTTVVIVTNSKIQVYEVALRADVVLVSVATIAEPNDLVVSDKKSGISVALYNNGTAFQATPPTNHR